MRGIALILLSIGCVPLGLYFGVENDKIDSQSFIPFVLVSVFALFQGVRFLKARSNFIKQTKLIPGYGEKLTWTFQSEGYGARIGESRSFVAWTHVSETKLTPDGVLIYPQPGLWEWLPKFAFTSETDYARFLDLLAAKTKHSKLGC